MGNKKHLNILARGVKTWNSWRRNNPEVQPDLSNVSLVGSDISFTDVPEELVEEVLKGKEILITELNMKASTWVDLVKAVVKGESVLFGDFNKANFSNTNLSDTSFFLVQLSEANLRGSTLKGAIPKTE